MVEEKPVKEKKTASAEKPIANQVKSNDLAVAAMVVGIMAVITSWIAFWGLLAGIAAVVLGIMALKKPVENGMSITGIATGGVAILTNLLFIIFFIISLAAGTAVVDETQNQIKDGNSSSQQTVDAKKNFAKGETAIFENFEVKINSVTRNYVPESTFFQPDEGNEYIVLNVTVTNIGDGSAYVSPSMFSVNDDGIAVDSAFVTAKPTFKSGDLSPQASTTGNIVYEVTKDSTNLKLQYETVVYGETYNGKELVYTLAF